MSRSGPFGANAVKAQQACVGAQPKVAMPVFGNRTKAEFREGAAWF